MGNRDGIDEMSSTSSSVLLSILKLIDKYDLYGQVAYPKHHKQSDVPDIYRLAAKSKVLLADYVSQFKLLRMLLSVLLFSRFIIVHKFLQGVFINPAVIEPFGLTLIEVYCQMCVSWLILVILVICDFFLFPSRLQPMVCQWLLQKMVVL